MSTTPNQAALNALLRGDDLALARLRSSLARTMSGGDCTACGHHGPHDDNGESGTHLSFRCAACGEQWDACPL